MSSVIKKPFGQIKHLPKDFVPTTERRRVFRVVVEATDVEDLLEFLELVYDTHVQVRMTTDAGKLFFTAAPHYSAAGIRVGLRLYGAEAVSIQEW